MSISKAATAFTGIEGKIELLALNFASCDWSSQRRLAESSAWSGAWDTALEDRGVEGLAETFRYSGRSRWRDHQEGEK
jgi:hypothetical protein